LGELSTEGKPIIESIVRQAIKNVGYDDESKGMDYKNVNVLVAVDK